MAPPSPYAPYAPPPFKDFAPRCAPDFIYSRPPPKSFGEILDEYFKKSSTMAANLVTLACFVGFALLIGLDVWRAFKKRAIWLPGKAFALSGVTVQIIVWWTSLSNVENGYDKQIGYLIWYHYMVVCGRVAVCVFIGYLLPGMAAPSVRAFAALAITISAQTASELMLLYNPHTTAYSELRLNRSRITDLTLLICIILLGLILCCTVLASKTIRGLFKQRISAIVEKNEFFQLSNQKLKSTSPITEGEVEDWDKFEKEVVKSWFAARVCRDDYVISRSCFSSAVWVLVTICAILFFMWLRVYTDITILPLLTFIVIGWIIICWRWMVAQLYCPPRCSWRRFLCLEDFWASRTVELIEMYDLKREQQQFQKSKPKARNKKSQSLVTTVFTELRFHKLLYLVLALQLCVLLFSKVCALLSAVTVGYFVHSCRKENSVASCDKYYEEILEFLRMPGEYRSALWEANKMSLNKAKRLMKKGDEEGRSSKEINSIFSEYKVEWANDGAALLIGLTENALPSILKYFPSVEKQYLKMTVVSLLSILIELPKAEPHGLTKVVKACDEIWDLISFADECDIDLQADKINLIDDLSRDKDQVLMAADRKFYKLQLEYDKLCERSIQGDSSEKPIQKEGAAPVDTKEVRAFLEKLCKNCEKMLQEENLLIDDRKFPRDLLDSKQWTKIGPSYTLYKLCKLMLHQDIEDYVKWIKEALRNVIACSMSRLPYMLVKQCWLWAQDFEEDKLWEAIQLAGKCKGIKKEWGQGTKMTGNTREHKTAKPTEEEASQGDRPVSEKDQYAIQVCELSSQEVPSGTH